MARRRDKKLLYWDWIRAEAVMIKSDGCSKVIDFHKDCCLLHDLAYYHGRCPKDAYSRYVAGEPLYWLNAKRIARADADEMLKQCYHDKSPINGFSPLMWTRWFGVRAGGWWAWRNHRKERP